MSRMHASRRGRSGSKRPLVDKKPGWVQQSPDEVKTLVAKLAGEGVSMARIGLILRDQHAVPDVRLVTGMSMKEIYAEKGIKAELPEDLSDLMRKAVSLNGHIKSNPKDRHNIRGMQLVESKIRRLAKYYKREGILPEGWSYSIATAALQIE
jgi:small subunit ribosomal protein S15